jgi:hypothetical protein
VSELSDAGRDHLEAQERQSLHQQRQWLRRQRRECADEAQAVLPQLTHLALEHHDILTMAELKVLGGAEEILRSIANRMRNLNRDE